MRGELAGAWRSVRYDLRGRPADRPDGPDVTSTGLSTFPGSLMEWRTVAPETDARPPRRFVAITVLCLIALVGAIGSYILVTRGLAAASTDRPEAASTPPPAAVTADGTPAGSPTEGPAESPVKRPVKRPVETPVDTPVDAGPTAAMGAKDRHRGAAGRPATTPARPGHGTTARKPAARRPPAPTPECDCVAPPVPTPTAPAPSRADGPEPGKPSAASPSGPPVASTEPGPGASDEDAADTRRHGRRHWQKTR
jgi:hypothetical protein